MKYSLKYILPFAIILLTACNNNQKTEDAKPQNALLFPQGEKITNNNFTGTVYLHMITEAHSLNSIVVGNVPFEAGARSNWYLHPARQILLVTDGVGYYHEKRQPKKILRKGDVIKCPPSIPHWHGASSDETFVQVTITGREKGKTVWLEPVTDEEYNSLN